MDDPTPPTPPPIDEALARLTAAAIALDELRPRLEARAPWPLADRFDHTDETVWGPPEVLAHCEEMLRFWSGEIARIVDTPGDGPVTFGRIATDEVRVGIVGRDRSWPLHHLLDLVAAEVERVTDQLALLYEDAFVRTGEHRVFGILTVTGIVDRLLASHLEDHVRQLETCLADAPTEPQTGA